MCQRMHAVGTFGCIFSLVDVMIAQFLFHTFAVVLNLLCPPSKKSLCHCSKLCIMMCQFLSFLVIIEENVFFFFFLLNLESKRKQR